MPLRSFEHWYRGLSVDTAYRSSTPALWGFRGSFVAPVNRMGSNQSTSGTGGLAAGGSTWVAASGFMDLRKKMAAGGTTASSTLIATNAEAIFEIVAAAEVSTLSDLAPAGGWSASGTVVSTASIDAVGEGGVGVSTSAAATLIVGRAQEWVVPLGGMTQVATIGAEVASGGLSTRLKSTVFQAYACEGSGGVGFGGGGLISVIPPQRSFKYWLRGGVIGDIGPRRSDFAPGFRNWLGLPSPGKAGGAEISARSSAFLMLGGSAGDGNQIDGRVSSVGMIGLGGAAALNRHFHVDAFGGAAHGGKVDVGVEIPFNPHTGRAVGGNAQLQDQSPIAPAIVTLPLGGGVIPRLVGTNSATVVMGVASVALHHTGIQAASSFAAHFGASARVSVGHWTDSVAKRGAEFGGEARDWSAYAFIPNGGLALGGTCQFPGRSLVYRIYSNGGLGGPIDYTSPIAETTGVEWTSDPLPAGSFYRFGVRTYDASSGLMEENLDASVSLILDHAGRDATRIPRAPIGLRAIDLGGGRARLEWTDGGGQHYTQPTHFHVYISENSISEYTSPIVVTTGTSRGKAFSAEIDGLADGRRYAAVVRARNAYGEEGNVTTVHFTADSTPPMQVDGLSGSISASVG